MSPSVDTRTKPPRKFRSLKEIYDNTHEIDEEVGLCFLSVDEPTNYAEAAGNENWRHAMIEEIEAIRKNNTWEFAKLPEGHRAIGLKWVYKVKKNPEREIVRHKARLVAKGYVKKHGLNFHEVFAFVARLETVRLLIALAAQESWEIHQWMSSLHS